MGQHITLKTGNYYKYMAIRENTSYKQTLAPLVQPVRAAVAARGPRSGSAKTSPISSIGNMARNQYNPQKDYGNLLANVNKNKLAVGQRYGNLGTVTTMPAGTADPRYTRTRGEARHPGIDIGNKIGTPVPTFAPGRVSEVVSGKKQGDKAYGNYVVVTDNAGNKHRYSHLSQSWVKVGQQLGKGTPVGAMGNTGQSYSLHGGTGSHLDYRIKDAYGKYINPLTYL